MLTGTEVFSPGRIYKASVLAGGEPQPLYRRRGDGQLFAAGKPGTAYQLCVHNLTGARIEVITSVDGRNTLKDEPADLESSTGFVLDPGARHVFSGWRLDDGQTREFVFTDLSASVESQATGAHANAGIIGFAAYRGAGHTFTLHDPGEMLRSGKLAGQNASYGDNAVATAAAGPDLGTGMGAKIHDPVGRTTFSRSGAPDIVVIRYQSEDSLREAGILAPPEPSAFPGAGTGYEHVKYGEPAC